MVKYLVSNRIFFVTDGLPLIPMAKDRAGHDKCTYLNTCTLGEYYLMFKRSVFCI